MAVGTERLHIGPRDHIVQFYGQDAELVEKVGDYLLGAVTEGCTAVVIATPGHRRAFAERLADAGVELAAARSRGAYLDLDARDALDRFLVDGRLDGAAFRRMAGEVMRSAAERGRPVRAYGEMVALLWDSGMVNAAIEVEALWEGLGREHPFSLFCAYPARSVAGDDHFAALSHAASSSEVRSSIMVSARVGGVVRRTLHRPVHGWHKRLKFLVGAILAGQSVTAQGVKGSGAIGRG